jgi:hypothetical protein
LIVVGLRVQIQGSEDHACPAALRKPEPARIEPFSMTSIGYRMPSVGPDCAIAGFALTDIIMPRTILFDA